MNQNQILNSIELGFVIGGNVIFSDLFGYSEREFQRGDEIAWYADGDKIVRNEYNPVTAYAFGSNY